MLTIFSMALGVMLVVAVLTIYGVVERSFKSNTSFGYDVIVGARGGSAQLMLNTVFYLSKPVENVPYEYYLSFRDKEVRNRELQHSFAYNSHLTRQQLQTTANEMASIMPFAGPLDLFTAVTSDAVERDEVKEMTFDQNGHMYNMTDIAVPLALGDYFNEKFRVVGTTPEFFSEVWLDIETKKQFEFSSGQAFVEFSEEYGYFECVLGATVARESGNKVGDVIYPIHGDPNSEGAHIHEQGFTIVGILKPTGTANDRVAFTNLEGHFLMEDHAKPIEEQGMFGAVNRSTITPVSYSPNLQDDERQPDSTSSVHVRTKLPIEQREVTAILVRSYIEENDESADDLDDLIGGLDDEEEELDEADQEIRFLKMGMGSQIRSAVNDGQLESSLGWSFYRPIRSQRASQAISPVYEVTSLFENIISPIRWLLLLLTFMICIVSGISILVGIYNSMTQRKHELAVMRALGAGRSKVMLIMLMESALLALAGGLLGWIAGHGLNVAVSPYVEGSTGVTLGFFEFAPAVPIGQWLEAMGGVGLPKFISEFQMSPELLLIPGLVLLSVMVGIYPAMTAYKTDVANSLSRT